MDHMGMTRTALVCLLAACTVAGLAAARAEDDGAQDAAVASDTAPASQRPLRGASQSGAPSYGDGMLFPDSEPIPDRWRITPPPYEKNVTGHWWDPYNQNLLKGDYPILGQDIFLRLTGATKIEIEGHRVPTGSGASATD